MAASGVVWKEAPESAIQPEVEPGVADRLTAGGAGKGWVVSNAREAI